MKNVYFSLAKKFWGVDTRKRITLYKSVFRPKLTYACQIWFRHLNRAQQNKLNSIQHTLLKHATQAYNTVSFNVIHSISRTLILSDHIQEIINQSNLPPTSRILANLFAPTNSIALLDKYRRESNGTFKSFFPHSIPKYVCPNFFNMQFLSDHGNFKAYLKRFKFSDDESCSCGYAVQNSSHLLLSCPNFDINRPPHFSTSSQLHELVNTKESYILFNQFCRSIVFTLQQSQF